VSSEVDEGRERNIAITAIPATRAITASMLQRHRFGGDGESGLDSGSGPACSDRESEFGVTSAGAVDMGGHSRRKNYFFSQTLYDSAVVAYKRFRRNN